MELKSKLPHVGMTIFSVMSNLAAEHEAINLSQGFPDFPIDPALKVSVEKALKANQVQYAPMPGRLDLRKTIAQKIKAHRDIVVNPETEITITAGATQAIYTIISAVIREGDEVILFDPAYDCYAPTILMNNGVPIHLKLTNNTYQIDWDEVRDKLSEKTKLIIVNNPHNPTGSVLNQADLSELKQCLVDYPELVVLSDEVYEHIQFDGKHISLLEDEFIRSRTFTTYSFGKTLHVTGWKLGYCVAPEKMTNEIRKIHQYMVFCANNTIQYAVNDYLSDESSWRGIAEMYKRKRDLFLSKIETSKFRIIPCEGTYFCLLDYSQISTLSDVEFAKELTVKYGVATIPVSVFYADKTDRKVIRVCFAKSEETLINAAERLCKI